MLTKRQLYMQVYNKQYAIKHRQRLLVRNKKRRLENLEKYREYDKERYWSNPQFHRNRWKKYSRTHRSIVNKRRRERYAADMEYKLKCIIRARLISTIKQNQKKGSILAYLGCTIPELKAHLEALFQPGMSWKNWSTTGWHIDHIKPLTSFKNPLNACHFSNLSPLWASENQKKGNRI